MTKRRIAALALIASIILIGVACSQKQMPIISPQTQIPVIIDTDMGFDD